MKPDTGFDKLLKSALVGLLWASVSVAVALCLKWDAVQLAKAFYLSVIYGSLFLIIKCIIWHLMRDPIRNDETDDFVFSWGSLLPDNWQFILFPLIALIFTTRELMQAISSKTEGWSVPYDTTAIPASEFVVISVENWWLVLALFGAAIWTFFKDLNRVKSKQLGLKKFRTRSVVKLTLLAIGSLLLTGFVTGVFAAYHSREIYLFLIIMFFLPWNTISEIIVKTYEDYWKLH